MKLMKLMMDERVKHRLTGVVVIISIAVIFVPAMIKKSNQRMGENINVSIKLPPKPVLPDVAMVKENALFDTIKVAHVEIPTLVAPPLVSQVASSVPLEIKPTPVKLNEPRVAKVAPPASAPVQAKTTLAALPAKVIKAVALKEGIYVVQLASFSQQSNAALLVTRLRGKGYKANYIKMTGKQGDIYKVLVGELNRRDDAQLLQKKLAESLQLNGFIVRTAVG